MTIHKTMQIKGIHMRKRDFPSLDIKNGPNISSSYGTLRALLKRVVNPVRDEHEYKNSYQSSYRLCTVHACEDDWRIICDKAYAVKLFIAILALTDHDEDITKG